MCAYVVVYKALRLIPFFSSDSDDDYFDDDRYDSLGYGFDLEEWLDEYHELRFTVFYFHYVSRDLCGF